MRVYDDRYQRRYGFWRPVIAGAVGKFLECGDLRKGFARVRCRSCHHEMFVAFSCRRRCLCPSCHQKRALVMAEDVAAHLCAPVPHRQFVFTLPKRLRIFFRFDRRLLGQLPRLAWETVLEVYRAVLDRPDITPGMLAAIHTFGQLLHHHSHLHALVTDGAFTADSRFVPLPTIGDEPFMEIWRRKVFALLLERGKITEDLVHQMLQWRHHSGFGVDRSVVLAAGDSKGLERVAQYMLRCPLSLARIIKVSDDGKVVYRAERRRCHRFPDPAGAPGNDLFGGVSRNFQVFDPLDFIAELTQHIPEHREHLGRRFGWYSNKARGMRAKARRDAGSAGVDQPPPDAPPAGDDPLAPDRREARRRWARLIQRVYEVDPLRCPACGGTMRIVSFIEARQRDLVRTILQHCGLWDASAPPPSSRAPPNANEAPSSQSVGELRYVPDLEFLQSQLEQRDAPEHNVCWAD